MSMRLRDHQPPRFAIEDRTWNERGALLFGMVQKGVRHRCRNGPEGAAHNGA
jgi:hypothetical protein